MQIRNAGVLTFKPVSLYSTIKNMNGGNLKSPPVSSGARVETYGSGIRGIQGELMACPRAVVFYSSIVGHIVIRILVIAWKSHSVVEMPSAFTGCCVSVYTSGFLSKNAPYCPLRSRIMVGCQSMSRRLPVWPCRTGCAKTTQSQCRDIRLLYRNHRY